MERPASRCAPEGPWQGFLDQSFPPTWACRWMESVESLLARGRAKAPTWGAPSPRLSATVTGRSAREQTMNTTLSELVLLAVLLAVVVLSARV
jgi:hypothetical protein